MAIGASQPSLATKTTDPAMFCSTNRVFREIPIIDGKVGDSVVRNVLDIDGTGHVDCSELTGLLPGGNRGSYTLANEPAITQFDIFKTMVQKQGKHVVTKDECERAPGINVPNISYMRAIKGEALTAWDTDELGYYCGLVGQGVNPNSGCELSREQQRKIPNTQYAIVFNPDYSAAKLVLYPSN